MSVAVASVSVGVVVVPVASKVWVEGTVMTGASVSPTITLNVEVAILPAESAAVQLIAVEPMAKREPERGVHDEARVPPTASVALGDVYVTYAPEEEVAEAVTFAWKSMTGAVSSITRILNVEVAIFAWLSLEIQRTDVVPSAKSVSEEGVQTTERAPSSVSTAVGKV